MRTKFAHKSLVNLSSFLKGVILKHPSADVKAFHPVLYLRSDLIGPLAQLDRATAF